MHPDLDIIAESKKLSRKKKLAEKKIVRKKIGKCTPRAALGGLHVAYFKKKIEKLKKKLCVA